MIIVPRKIELQIPVLHFTLIGKVGTNKNFKTLLLTPNILQSSLKSVTFQKTRDLLNAESDIPVFNASYIDNFCIPLKRKGLLQQIVDNEESAFLLETSVRCPYLQGQRKLSISVPFSRPANFSRPFFFRVFPTI